MKKSEMSMNVVIMAVLGLVVLIVLILVFNDQIRGAAAKYFNIGQNAGEGAEGKRCVTLISSASRKCIATCEEGWTEISPSDKEWKDCKSAKCCEKAP